MPEPVVLLRDVLDGIGDAGTVEEIIIEKLGLGPDDNVEEVQVVRPGLRIMRPEARTLRQAAEQWCDEYDKPIDVGGRQMIVAYGDDGFRVLCFVVDIADPPNTLEEWRDAVSISIDLPRGSSGYGSMLAEVIEV